LNAEEKRVPTRDGSEAATDKAGDPHKSRDGERGPSPSPAIDARLDAQTNNVVDALLMHALERTGPRVSLTRRVADRADAIALELDLNEEQRDVIRRAAVLRDVGRAGVPDAILKKKGPLTAREYDEVRARMLPEDDVDDTDRVRAAITIARHHHERVDGDGYPEQLTRHLIPLGSRVLAVAEAYETMLVAAAWRPAHTPLEALEQIRGGVNTQFDPEVVEALARTVGIESAGLAGEAHR
jgi:HD-GYP domain-containing protein (c-di-GMP phosphodiesterase class II)